MSTKERRVIVDFDDAIRAFSDNKGGVTDDLRGMKSHYLSHVAGSIGFALKLSDYHGSRNLEAANNLADAWTALDTAEKRLNRYIVGRKPPVHDTAEDWVKTAGWKYLPKIEYSNSHERDLHDEFIACARVLDRIVRHEAEKMGLKLAAVKTDCGATALVLEADAPSETEWD